MKRTMYIIKIEGTKKIPDYVQIRDEDFTLIAYFRADKPESKRIPYLDDIPEDRLKEMIGELPYGSIRKIKITG